MATFACVSLPPQFITPPPSTSNCNQHNDSDCGSSTGTGGGEMKANETASEDGSTTSSQPTPPEYPSPPPPSNSPPESMASLQADSPILDERDTGGTEGGTGPGSSGSSGSHGGFGGPGGHRIGRLVAMRSPDGEQYVEVAEGVFVPISGYKGWVVQNGYQRVPWEGPLPPQPQSILFVHVNEGEMLSFLSRDDDEPCGNLVGPGTVRMVGDPGATSQPLPIQLRPDQQCHQFIDEEGNLRHVVLSLASPDSGPQIPRELNVPQVVGSQQLMHAIGGGNAGNGGNGGNAENAANNGQVVIAPNGGNAVHGNNGANNGNNGHQQQYQHRPPRNNRGGGRGGYRNNQNQDGYVPRYNNNGGRGGNRPNNRQYNGRNRDYHGRDNNNHHMVQGVPEMMNGHVDQSGLVPMNPEAPVMMGQPIPQMLPVGQISLLGEPTGPPMAAQPMMQAPPQQYQQQMMVVPQQEMPMQDMSMTVVPQLMTAAPMQTGLLQDPMMAGPSMSVPPPLYAMPPPNGMVMVPADGAPYNNNKWISYQSMEENGRIHEILSKALRTPTIANVLPTEVEFLWMPLKLGDWQIVVAGMMVQTENMEVAYQATVLDFEGKTVMMYHMDVNKFEDGIVSQLFRAHSLRPNSSYNLIIRAMVNERGILGEPTPWLAFRTAPGRPEAPTDVRIVGRGTDFFHITWMESINNGAFVSAYHVYIHENEFADGIMMRVTGLEVRISDLKAETRYKITISAINALGESLTSYELEAWTKAITAPVQPQNIRLTPTSHKSIRLNWDANPNCYFWIELNDTFKKTTILVREQFIGDCTVLSDLEPNREYRIRITARNDCGESQSEWITARTQAFRKIEHGSKGRNYNNEDQGQRQSTMPNLERPPSNPFLKRFVDNCPEIEWKSHGPGQKDFVYVAEGSTYEMPEKYVQLYRGPAHTLIVVDDTMHYIRVYIIHKKGQRSHYTDRVVIPRDYSQYRPDRVVDVKASLTKDGCVLVEWSELDRKAMKLPETARLLYFVQRSELPDCPIIGAGVTNQCKFENVPGETTVNVRVRAGVSFHDALVHGDWSSPVTFTTPRTLPPAVINIKYNSESSLLKWDCLDQSSDLQFTVEVFERPAQTPVMKVITKEKNVVLDGVQPGKKYSAVLTSYTNVGRTPHHTAFDFSTPALKPSAPEEGFMVHSVTDKCTVAWTAANPNGSPITGYVLKLHLNKKLLRESVLPTHEERNYRVNIKDLKPNTVYTAAICGRNAVGDGDPVCFTVLTKPLPPVAPEIECDAEAYMLKLHWDNVTSSPSISYKMMRVNSRGQHMTVYEGENNSVKVKNLTENTEYSFQLKVTDKITGADAISEIHTFKTSVAPPPPIKQSPTSSLVAGEAYLHLVSWKDVLPKDDAHEQFYRLQVVDATVQGAKWSVAYEGTMPSFELNTESFPGALHVRVLVIRPEKEKELKGSPSPVGYIGNDPPVIEPKPEDETNKRRRLINWRYFGIHPVIILILLVVLLVIMVNFSETLFHWVTGSSATATPNATGAPQQPPPTITPNRPPGAQ